MNEEDNRRVYGAKDAFLRLPTSFGKSVRLTVNKASWVQGGGSYAVILLVSPLVSLTIAKFNGLSVHYVTSCRGAWVARDLLVDKPCFMGLVHSDQIHESPVLYY